MSPVTRLLYHKDFHSPVYLRGSEYVFSVVQELSMIIDESEGQDILPFITNSPTVLLLYSTYIQFTTRITDRISFRCAPSIVMVISVVMMIIIYKHSTYLRRVHSLRSGRATRGRSSSTVYNLPYETRYSETPYPNEDID